MATEVNIRIREGQELDAIAAPTMADPHQQHHDQSSSSLSSSPTGTSDASSPMTSPILSRCQSHTSLPENVQPTFGSEPSRIPLPRSSQLNSSAISKDVQPADETTGIVARSDSRNYAATVSTDYSSIRDEAKKKTSGWLGKFGAIELENKGSVARDHLALERTFLAWLRTSLAFTSIGIAITQLFRLNTASGPSDAGFTTLSHMGKPLGATFIGISILVLAIGANRYYESQSWLMKGKFPASRGSIFLLALVTCLLMITTLVIVMIAQPSNHES